MEERRNRLSIRGAGGNASKAAKRYGLDLPSLWVQAMGISPEEREVIIAFDGKEITISKADSQEREKKGAEHG